ncbi:MAG: tetratricopeptide repeat protein [Chloroflexota bacterium]|nr:tetratricopeptide repeat protein [Chloroflexota bacterium]
MSNKIPVIRQINWFAVAAQTVIVIMLILLIFLLTPPPETPVDASNRVWRPLLIALCIYVGWSFISKLLAFREHRKGMLLIRQEKYREAIEAFKRSYDQFADYPWIDRLRWLVCLDASAVSYREMALVNIAFCHVYLDEGEQAKQVYERVLQEFPGSMIARSAMRMIESFEKRTGTSL